MDILVTGGCGYIGSSLIPYLQAQSAVDSVTVFDSLACGSPRNLIGARVSDGFSFRDGDVREYGDVESAMRDVDTVIHLAAITGASTTHDRREETFAVNYDGTENVLKAATKLGVSNVVFASSCNIYGRAPTTDIDETTDPDPINPYADSKLQSESLLESYVDEDMDGTALRMSTVYGYAPGIRFNLVVNHFVFRALTGRPLTVYGDGTNWRPFIHIEDAAKAFAEAALNPEDWQQMRYNVGSNAGNYQIKDVAAAVRDELDADLEITYLEDEHPGPSYHVNFDRLAATGYSTEVSLREGIRELAERFTGSNDAGRID